MLRRVRIVKSNNSDFLPNELVDSTLFRKTNQELVKDGKVPAEGRPELMGITKASLATDSWYQLRLSKKLQEYSLKLQ